MVLWKTISNQVDFDAQVSSRNAEVCLRDNLDRAICSAIDFKAGGMTSYVSSGYPNFVRYNRDLSIEEMVAKGVKPNPNLTKLKLLPLQISQEARKGL